MSVESKIFTSGAIVFVLMSAVYGFVTSRFAPNGLEPAGTIGILFVGLMCAMVGFYLSSTAKKLDARPEDDPAALISDVEGDYGFFSPSSWWPMPLAFAAMLLFLGLAVGWWVFIVGLVLGVVTLLGWTYEYFRGDMSI